MEGLEPDQVPLSAGLAYWQYCMLNVLRFTQNSTRKIFIAYDQLIQNPERECTRLGQFLDGLQGTTSNAEGRIRNMCSQISSNKWHYQHLQSLSEIETVTREQRALFNILRVKTLYPDEPINPDDFSLYEGWQEYLHILDILVSQMLGKEST